MVIPTCVPFVPAHSFQEKFQTEMKVHESNVRGIHKYMIFERFDNHKEKTFAIGTDLTTTLLACEQDV